MARPIAGSSTGAYRTWSWGACDGARRDTTDRRHAGRTLRGAVAAEAAAGAAAQPVGVHPLLWAAARRGLPGHADAGVVAGPARAVHAGRGVALPVAVRADS